METVRRDERSFFEILYNHNPFYLMSACCVLYAIKRVFRPMEVPYIDPWMLMLALSGLTVFTAVTAWVVVRFGKVWEDARSLMLVLVILFLSMSVSFDELLNLQGRNAVWLLAVGFILSASITEAIVRLLKIPLPWLYRVPFCLILALFFGYPVLVCSKVTSLEVMQRRWCILGFPTVAGLCTLTLLPAVRRGPTLINDHGSPCPWKWPLLPWTLFGFLGLAVCGRSYYLSISFEHAIDLIEEMFTPFGVYALIPFLFCVSFVLLEIAFVQKNRMLQNAILCATTVVLFLFSIPSSGSDPAYADFLRHFTAIAGSPIFLTLNGLLWFAALAWYRGVQTGEYVVLAALFGLSYVGVDTLGIDTLTPPNPLPLSGLVGLILVVGIAKKDALRCLLAAAALCAAMAWVPWTDQITVFRRAIPAHLLVAAATVIGARLRGRSADLARVLGGLLLPVVTTITTHSLISMDGWRLPGVFYFVCMVTAAITYAVAREQLLCAVSGGMTLVIGAVQLTAYGLRLLSDLFGPEVVASIGIGIACFAVAALITAHKARGAPQRN